MNRIKFDIRRELIGCRVNNIELHFTDGTHHLAERMRSQVGWRCILKYARVMRYKFWITTQIPAYVRNVR